MIAYKGKGLTDVNYFCIVSRDALFRTLLALLGLVGVVEWV